MQYNIDEVMQELKERIEERQEKHEQQFLDEMRQSNAEEIKKKADFDRLVSEAVSRNDAKTRKEAREQAERKARLEATAEEDARRKDHGLPTLAQEEFRIDLADALAGMKKAGHFSPKGHKLK